MFRGMRFRLPRRRPEGGDERSNPDSLRVRPPRAAPVHVQIMGRESIDVVTARDISATGIGVHVPHGFDVWDLESDIELVVTLPGVSPFLATGMLRHRTKGFFGVEFTRLQAGHRDAIRRYVDTHADERC